MGRNKAFLPFQDKVMLVRIVGVLTSLAEEVLVVVSGRQGVDDYSALLPGSILIAKDLSEVQSPVVGILSGLTRVKSEYSCVVSCDVPFLNAKVLHYLFQQAEGRDAAIPVWPDGLLEPLQAVYRVEAARNAAGEALRSNELRNTDMIKRLKEIRNVPVEELKKFDSELLSFFNVNTPDEYQKALKILDRGI